MNTKICMHCRWHRVGYDSDVCYCPAMTNNEVDLVSGRPKAVDAQRSRQGGGACGPQGKHWEAYPPSPAKRFLKWLGRIAAKAIESEVGLRKSLGR